MPTPRSSPSPPASRARAPTRRLRRTGLVPGVIYGGGDEPLALRRRRAHPAQHARAFGRDPRRHARRRHGRRPVIVKDVQRHPVRGEAVHVDLLRVEHERDDPRPRSCSSCTGADEAPGVTEGGVLNQETRELNIEALPGDIPDSIIHDVSGLEMNETLTLSALTAPDGVTLLDDLDETVIATITPPTLEPVEDEIETETALVGEDGEPLEGEEPRAARPTAEAEAPGDEASSDDDLKLFSLHPGRLAGRRARQPRARLRELPAQRRLPGRRRADRALGPAEAEEEVRGRADRGPHRPGRPARRGAQAADVHERRRAARSGPARGSYKLDLDRILVAPRRDRPAVRRHPRRGSAAGWPATTA